MGKDSILNRSRTKHSIFSNKWCSLTIQNCCYILASYFRSAFVFNSSSGQMENRHTHFTCQTLDPRSDSWQLPSGLHCIYVPGCTKGQCFGVRPRKQEVRPCRRMQMPEAAVSPEASLPILWVRGQDPALPGTSCWRKICMVFTKVASP